MLPTHVLARDHLQRAAAILHGADSRTRQLRHIIERTITLMDQPGAEASMRSNNNNILYFSSFRER
ncbi:hypothetical protein SAMN04488059_10712 [Devosia psychrophila]|jgi:hypothetical protein|uniref:Uncharacterized protein n=1 Tax=Devosia psychrophila TaxID=728005 RepID=A0A1I1KD63_9HYPH|nr:hypothetical protein SAMN04488059_10712 [Devosia psychrophila]